MARVLLKKVCKAYTPEVLTVKNVDLNIKDGEFMVLVGPSGCGKSTTLRMIAGLEDITSGSIEIGDRVVNELPPRDRNIAMVFQSYALYPHMSVRDNMTFSLRIRNMAKDFISRRLGMAADILGLGSYLDRKPKALSGGQRQRVAMGRAIVREPEVFLFDEPLSNLDAKMRVEMRREIIKLHQRLKSTMIYVTHDQVEAMTLGDRICIMEAGVIRQVGSPGDVFDNPHNLFVANFIGTPPMNLIPGSLRQDGETLTFVSDGLTAKVPDVLADRVRNKVGGKVILGLRPRSFVEPGQEAPEGEAGAAWSATPEIAEMLGEESLVHLSAGENRFIVSMHPHHVPPLEQPCLIQPIMIRAHFFDPDNGCNLTLGVDFPGRNTIRRAT